MAIMFEPGFDPRPAALIQARFTGCSEEAVEASERLAELTGRAWKGVQAYDPMGGQSGHILGNYMSESLDNPERVRVHRRVPGRRGAVYEY